MSLADRWRWRKTRIEELDGLASQCLAPVCDLLEDQAVRNCAELDHRLAWGQFLDRSHYSDHQWGRFGTSAAVQVFAMAHHWDEPDRSVYTTSPLNVLAPKVLPSRPPSRLSRVPKSEDFSDTLKLAFMIDALCLDVLDDKVQGEAPELVTHLLSLALPTKEGWSTRDHHDGRRQDRLLVTAYSLHALRRFPDAQVDPAIGEAWEWLSTQLQRRSGTLGGDVLALGSLALNACPKGRQSQSVHRALATCRAELVSRFSRERRPAIDRPFFNPYSRGDLNDYLFLNPEILSALALLEYVEEEKRVRAFVLSVVNSVAAQIVGANLNSGEPQGFRSQTDMLGTVDQMWAIRILYRFHRTFQKNPGALRPPGTVGFKSGFLIAPALILVIILAIVSIGGTAATIIGVVLGAFLGAVFNLMIRLED